ncbi:MAG TPA: DMT family transporter, partial [Nocardioidaceae bacterium]|nr:DMT family transporter [Nocardioidaceae bacterium]
MTGPAMSNAARRGEIGLALALVSGATFGLSGSFGDALLDEGWSPLGVVLARITGAAALLLVPLLVVIGRGWRPQPGNTHATLVYGTVAVTGTQLCFFNAVQYLDVGVALLLEFSAPVLLLGWTWWRTGRPPSRLTSIGALVAVAGLLLVLDVNGDATLHPAGVAWGLGAAVCVSVYFQASARADSPPPLVLTTAGMVIGALALLLVGTVGLLPMTFSAADATLAGETLPWWAIVALIAGVSTAAAYVTGIMAIARLGSRIASFVGLSEVLFAVLGAWWLVAQTPTLQQLFGGVLIVGGIAIIRHAERAATTRDREPVR